MVYYFVIGADGQRYGPADVDALVLWAREGRLVGNTMLIERGTERAIRADALTAVAVELQKLSGQLPAVSIERSAHEIPTMTGAGSPGRIPVYPAQPYPARPTGLPPIPQGMPQSPYYARPVSTRSRWVAGLLGIFLGAFGVHRFYLGYTGIGLIQILITMMTMMTCSLHGIGALWGFIEGVICLCGGMKDKDGFDLRD